VIFVLAGLVWFAHSGDKIEKEIDSDWSALDTDRVIQGWLNKRIIPSSEKTNAQELLELGLYDDSISEMSARSLGYNLFENMKRTIPPREDAIWFAACIYGRNDQHPNPDRNYGGDGGLAHFANSYFLSKGNQKPIEKGPCYELWDTYKHQIDCTGSMYADFDKVKDKEPNKLISTVVVPNYKYGKIIIYACTAEPAEDDNKKEDST